jgi:putative transposase
MTRYIDTHRDRFGVEPICRALQVAPSTYYATKRRPPSARAVRDAELAPKIQQVFDDNYQVYGVRKLWRQLQRQGERVGRDQVARLMRTLGIAGVVRGKSKRTTVADPAAVRAPDLVNRQFTATRPNQLWVSDFTYVASWSGTVYVAFIIDVFSRLIVGWRAAASMRTELVLDALEMAVCAARRSWMAWSATPMPARNTRRFATPTGSPRSARPRRSGASATATTTVWPSPRSGCSRPN